MMISNSSTKYGLLAKAFHWVSALTIFGLFALGWWMVELTYYDPWYKQGPDIHKSVGILLLIFMVFRLVWRAMQRSPEPVAEHKPWERSLAHAMHWVLYLLIFAIIGAGYLISTADGRGISVFNWFEVPSLGALFDQQEDIAGLVHEWLAYGVIALALLHALAAIKHHFLDRDGTLKRML